MSTIGESLHGHNIAPVGYFSGSETGTLNLIKSWGQMEGALKDSGALLTDIPVIHTYSHEVPVPAMDIFKASVREEFWKKLNMPYEKVSHY